MIAGIAGEDIGNSRCRPASDQGSLADVLELLVQFWAVLRDPSLQERCVGGGIDVVGSGSQKKYLEDLVNTLGLVSDTLFTGYINQDEIHNYHNMFDIFVVPSVKESFGVSALEASACGKPVIVSNVGGLPEVVENEKTGLIVEKQNSSLLAEAIEKLISNLKMREEFGNNGRQKVLREYDWQHSLDTMVAVYNSVVTK